MKKKIVAMILVAAMAVTMLGCAAAGTEAQVAGTDGSTPVYSSVEEELCMVKVNDAAELAKAKIEAEYNSIADLLYAISLLEGENNAYAKSVNEKISPIHDQVLTAVDDIVKVNKENMASDEYYEQNMNEQSLKGISEIYDSWNAAYISIYEELKNQYAKDIETIAKNIETLTGNISQINGIFIPESGDTQGATSETGAVEQTNDEAAAQAAAEEAKKAEEKKAALAKEAAAAQAALDQAQAQQAALEEAQQQAAQEAQAAQAALEAAQAAQAAVQ